MKLLEGRVAIVTGAGNGIGRAHALHLASLGAQVVVNDVGGARDGSEAGGSAADEVVREIEDAGGAAVSSHDSVAVREGAERIVWAAMNRFGRLDILVNNAGILRDRTLLNATDAELDAVLAVHLRGTFLMSQLAARQMKIAGRGGRIINTSSVSGLIGNFGQSAYAAAKAGIYGLTRVAALELARSKITVNAIAPVALTRMTADLAHFEGVSLDAMGPQHIAPLVGFLASDLAAHLTGKVFGIEGRRIFEYRMETSEGVTADGAWTPEGVAAELERIMR